MEKKEIHGSSDKWAESLQSVFDLALENQGPERTAQLLNKLADRLRASQDGLPRGFNTPYLNTIPPEQRRKTGMPRASHAATFTSVATLFA